MSTVETILERWPLRSMCARLGVQLPERGRFCSPFRPDNKPSCEVWKETIRDRSTGESFDAIRVFAEVKGMSNSEAVKALAAELPGRQTTAQPNQTRHKLTLPRMSYSRTAAHALANRRGLSPAGPELAGVALGNLGFGEVGGFACWILTDSGRIAEARRMDGLPFPAVGDLGERKTHTLRGSCKSWPVGVVPPKLRTIPDDAPVVLLEGGPDYLAACDLLPHVRHGDFLPVAMLGAGQSIHADALRFFRGRKILILAHPDDAGLTAAKRWAGQLREAGANPTARQLDGGDLNDLVKLHGAEAIARQLDL